ncbi:MAG: hypothetical protein E4H10_03735 [Bacteroidia bacterium]|nr:MAG: hypothetical protein E4H10_03735 [Bacteroidia bacterium]
MRYTLSLAGLFLLIFVPLSAQYEDVPTFEDTLNVYADLFYIKEPLNLTLKFNLKEFGKTRRDEKYHPAELTCHVTDSFQVTHPVRVRARGKLRRDICTVPPYWLNIRYSGIEAEDLQDVVKMKVVTRCKLTAQFEYYVLREYLVYQLYNLLTDYSFNTRLVRIKYIDTGRKMKEAEDWGFLIEPNDKMAERNNAMIVDSDKLSIRTVNKEIMDKMAFFCYMIGQGDYSVTGQHNLRILALKEYGPTGFIPVPYDFDYVGLVDAIYAVPGEQLGITSVKERYYLGACRDKETHQRTINWLASYQDEMVELIMNFEYLPENEKLDMIDYLGSYFVDAERESFIDYKIDPTCR